MDALRDLFLVLPFGRVSAPRRLFDDPYVRGVAGAGGGMANYDLSPTGDRFVMLERPAGSNEPLAARTILTLNWFEELRRRVPE